MKTQKPSFEICSPRIKPQKGSVLVLDVGTTGIKAFVFDAKCRILAKSYSKISKTRPHREWIEQDPMEILRLTISVLRLALKNSGVSPSDVRGIGITNQREATILWDKKTGEPVYPIIGWEDTRTQKYCQSFSEHDQHTVQEKTGLPIDSYFSASKIRWIIDHIPQARTLMEAGQLAFGTIDSWLLWNLCEERPHLTDETNASRTLLYNIHTRQWDNALLALFGIPSSILPAVRSSRSHFGVLKNDLVGITLPILAICGDQQASTYAAIRSSSSKSFVKITYGTGIFVTKVLGSRALFCSPFITTLVPDKNGTSFALEGKVEGSGEAVDQLLNDPSKLRPFLKKLAVQIDGYIKLLPKRPKEIIIDGGIARDGIIVELQEQVSGISTCLQATYDGTALGTALLAWDAVGNNKQITPLRNQYEL